MPFTVWGILEVCSIVLCLATIASFLGRLWWIFELTSHFPLQYALCLAALALAWTVFREWYLAGICGVCAIVNAILVALVYLPEGEQSQPAGQSLRIVSINVHTLNTRSDLVLDFLRNANADVILLMEVNNRWVAQLETLHTNYSYSLIQPREDNFGIAMFSRLPLINGRVLEFGSAGVPSVGSSVKVGDETVYLLGTHPLPPGSAEYARLRNEQLEAVARYVRSAIVPVVVAGDLNVTPWSPFFRDLIRESGLKNTSRGRGLFRSWPAWLWIVRIPIDQCLVSPSITVIDKSIGPKVGSDHMPVVVDLQIPAAANTAPGSEQP